MRIPFLGKRRKSIAALRSSAIVEEEENEGKHGKGHYRTVSQLANETAARLARSSFGAAGSLSTVNLDVHRSGASTQRNYNPNARHTMMAPTTTQTPVSDNPQEKRSSLRPKASFLSRITSRPSLAARYSSADLKSTARSRDGFFKSPEKLNVVSAAPRHDITHTHTQRKQMSVGDTDFSKPRIAPSPPMLSLQSPSSSLLDSPPTSTGSPLPRPVGRMIINSTIGPYLSSPGEQGSTRRAMELSKRHSSVASLSPVFNQNSPRKRIASLRDQPVSPEMTHAVAASISDLSNSPIARRRPTHVRVGSEKVTLSVANALESGLGVRVDDSEDSSCYDDSYEDKQQSFSRKSHIQPLISKHVGEVTADPLDLPPLPEGPKPFPKKDTDAADHVVLDSESPLCALMGSAHEADAMIIHSQAQDVLASTRNTYTSVRSHGRPYFFTASVDRLDRISERSIPISQPSPNVEAGSFTKEVAVQSSPELTQQLQSSLDAQCARFDRLAAHMLDIIQRHQSEKVELETRISVLEKEARRSEREIKALRQLLSQSGQRTASRPGTHRLTRAISMQSFLSNISFKDEDIDVSLAIDMLSRVSALDLSYASSVSKDGLNVAEFSTNLTPAARKISRPEMRRAKTMPDLHSAIIGPPPEMPLPLPSPLPVSPDVSGGLGLGLDFPIPGPIKLPSISSAIITSTGTSSGFLPALTAASTAASGLSLSTEKSFKEMPLPPMPVHAFNFKPEVREAPSAADEHACDSITDDYCSFVELYSPVPPPETPKTQRQAVTQSQTPKIAREKRMAGEWGIASGTPSTRLYRTAQNLPQACSPPTYAVPDIPQFSSTPKEMAMMDKYLNASEAYTANLNKYIINPSHEQDVDKESPDLDELFSRIVASGSSLLG